MKKVGIVETPLNSGELYIMLGSNLEYNDSTYSEFGEMIVGKNIYSTIEEAKKHLLEKINMEYGFLKLYEIEEWTWASAKDHSLYKAYEELTGTPMHSNESILSEYIDWIKQFDQKTDVIAALPPFVTIYKMELNK